MDVSFGSASKEIKAIDWNTFTSKLLPPAEKVLEIGLSGGMVQESAERDTPTVNPYELRIMVDSQIPVMRTHGRFSGTYDKGVGIKPMGVTADGFNTDVRFETLLNGEDTDVFEFRPVRKNVPAALWQPAAVDGRIPGKSAAELIEDVVCGFEIVPGAPTLGNSITIPTNSLDDVLNGPTEQPRPGTGFNAQAPAALSPELIQAFYPAQPR